MNKIAFLIATAALAISTPAMAHPDPNNPHHPDTVEEHVNTNTNTATAVGVGVGIAESTATGGNASVTAGSVSGGSITSTIVGGDTNNSSQGGSVGNTSSNSATNVTVEGDNQRRIPVSTAYAAPLVSGLDTCLGSTSGGAQTSVFGFTLGGTKRDQNCERIKLSRELSANGYKQESCELLRQDPRVAAAFAVTGRSCVSGATYIVPPTLPEAPVITPTPERG